MLGLSRNWVPLSLASLYLCYYRLFNVLQPRTFPADVVGPGPWCLTPRGGGGSGGLLFPLMVGVGFCSPILVVTAEDLVFQA